MVQMQLKALETNRRFSPGISSTEDHATEGIGDQVAQVVAN